MGRIKAFFSKPRNSLAVGLAAFVLFIGAVPTYYGSLNVPTGGTITDSNFTSGNCVQTTTGGLFTASPCPSPTPGCNAAVTPSPAPSGYNGVTVCAQATAEPTMQPGNPYVQNYVMGEGQSGGIWETCVACAANPPYNGPHHHAFWLNNLGDANGPGDIAIGGCALCNGDAGSTGQNIAIGGGAMESISTGYRNHALGGLALRNTTSGYNNVGIGYGSGSCLTTGFSNFILGDALSDNTLYPSGCNASDNVYLGPEAGFEVDAATYTVGIGLSAGEVNNGSKNIFIGWNAGSGSTGSNGIAIGSQASQNDTSGGNIAIGSAAGASATAGGNVFIGNGAGQNNTSGATNTLIGASAGGSSGLTGSNNTFVGYRSGIADTSGNQNVFIGFDAATTATTASNSVAIGVGADGIGTASWDVAIGNNATVPSGNGAMSIANAIYGVGNTLATTGISGGCITFYATSCSSATGFNSQGVYVGGTGPFGYAVPATSCTGTHPLPCSFTWTCTMASGACTTTATVPASSTCTLTPNVTPVISTTDVATYWATLASTTLTVHVQDQLGTASSAFSGVGTCL